MENKNYRRLCESVFMDQDDMTPEIVVYTGMVDANHLPVFRKTIATDCCSVNIGNKEYWGIVCYESDRNQNRWYNYNDCVSLENWEVLHRMLDNRFEWMDRELNLRKVVEDCAKALLK